MTTARYRTIWLSDIHLGTRDCQAQALLDFLDGCECDYLYLVGDIIDFWRLKRTPYWPQLHSDVIRKVLSKARAGTVVTLVPGNHDEYLRRFCDLQLGNIMVTREAIHRTADGRLLLVVHGDEFDGITRCHRWLALTGDVGYEVLLVLNRWFNGARRQLGLPYWSLSAYIKGKVKRAVSFITAFEMALAYEAARRGLHGVVCGHIHRAETREIDGTQYCNTGDWVESCTALVEHQHGGLELLAVMPGGYAATAHRARVEVVAGLAPPGPLEPVPVAELAGDGSPWLSGVAGPR
jgi:UDP-2,3-diacylglucosamine pyrophosphatase LpxH